MENESKQTFDQWAVIELFGHQAIAGRATEDVIAGQGFVRVDVPAVSGGPEFTRYFGAKSIYSITPCSQAEARAAADNLFVEPLPLGLKHLELPDAGAPADPEDPFLRQ